MCVHTREKRNELAQVLHRLSNQRPDWTLLRERQSDVMAVFLPVLVHQPVYTLYYELLELLHNDGFPFPYPRSPYC